MSNEEISHYRAAHKLAKLICFALIVLLLVLNRETGSIYLDVLAVAIWFFGCNPVAHIIEKIMSWRHGHEWL